MVAVVRCPLYTKLHWEAEWIVIVLCVHTQHITTFFSWLEMHTTKTGGYCMWKKDVHNLEEWDIWYTHSYHMLLGDLKRIKYSCTFVQKLNLKKQKFTLRIHLGDWNILMYNRNLFILKRDILYTCLWRLETYKINLYICGKIRIYLCAWIVNAYVDRNRK